MWISTKEVLGISSNSADWGFRALTVGPQTDWLLLRSNKSPLRPAKRRIV
jgi:hypothetical protein